MTRRMRSPSTRVRETGKVRKDTAAWLAERVSAVMLLPLTVWLVAAFIAHTGSDYAMLIAWLRKPITTILMALLLIALFWHTALGLRVVIDDYIHSGARTPMLILMRLACVALAVAGIFAVLRIAFGD